MTAALQVGWILFACKSIYCNNFNLVIYILYISWNNNLSWPLLFQSLIRDDFKEIYLRFNILFIRWVDIIWQKPLFVWFYRNEWFRNSYDIIYMYNTWIEFLISIMGLMLIGKRLALQKSRMPWSICNIIMKDIYTWGRKLCHPLTHFKM